MTKTFKLNIESGEYDNAFDTFFAEFKKETHYLSCLEIYDDGESIYPEEFLQKCTAENQDKLISYLIEYGVPSDDAGGGLPIGMTIASGNIPYIRALDFDHLTHQAYEELLCSINEDDWSEADIELYVVICFNGDNYQMNDIDSITDSLLDKMDEDDEVRDKLLEFLKIEKDLFAQRFNKETADELYEEFLEAIEEE